MLGSYATGDSKGVAFFILHPSSFFTLKVKSVIMRIDFGVSLFLVSIDFLTFLTECTKFLGI